MKSSRQFLLWGWLGMTSAFAQQVEVVYPPYAVADEETRFIAQGSNFPLPSSAALGMKVASTPSHSCAKPRRYREVTGTHYFFACTFEITQNPVQLRIYTRNKKESGPTLWQGNIQVLPESPEVHHIVIKTGVQKLYSRIACDNLTPCLTVEGLITRAQNIELEVRGRNLPHSLVLDFPKCSAPVQTGNAWDTERRAFTCRPSALGLTQFKVLSAQSQLGGKVLFANSLDVVE